MYKKGMAALTEELARVKERSKAAIQDLETELARRELEQAALKKDLDEERYLRKQVEKTAVEVEMNADERIKSVRQDLETALAKLRDLLAKRELEQAELKKDLYEERLLRKQLETVVNLNELPISILRTEGPGVSPSQPMAIVQNPIVQLEVESPSIPNGIYFIKNRTGSIYWSVRGWPSLENVLFWTTTNDISEHSFVQVNDH